MSLEGGFQGRTNKLVDGCYSFWMGGVFPIIGKMLESLDVDNSVLDFVYDRGNHHAQTRIKSPKSRKEDDSILSACVDRCPARVHARRMPIKDWWAP